MLHYPSPARCKNYLPSCYHVQSLGPALPLSLSLTLTSTSKCISLSLTHSLSLSLSLSLYRRDEDSYQKFIPFIGVGVYTGPGPHMQAYEIHVHVG